jgi:hypothetical protein
LDVTPEKIWEHLTIQETFEPWMTLENIGRHSKEHNEESQVWNIDHRIPIFAKGTGEDGAITREDLLERLHYTNLQPLRAYANQKKGYKILQ